MNQMDSRQHLNAAFDPKRFQETGQQLIAEMARALEKSLQRETDQVIPFQQAEQLWQEGLKALSEDPMVLFRSIQQHAVRLHHPRYVGHQIAPPLPLVALAGLLSDMLNNGMGVYEMGMAGTVMERYVVDWTARQFGLGEESSGFLTSGGTLANLTALLAARQAQSDHDIWQEGYVEGEKLAVMVSAEAHYCIARAVKIMGWGEEGIVSVPTDAAYRLDPGALESGLAEAQARGRRVIAVIGCSCSTATGSFDPLEAIADFCDKHQLWFHVDAAHGGPFAFSTRHKGLLAGSGRADSIVMDFHKMALCPALCTALLFRNGRHSYQTFAQKAAYLWDDPSDMEWHNLARRTFECTKDMMSIRPYVLLQHYGPGLLAEYVERMMDLTQAFVRLIESTDQLELLLRPEANIVCFRYVPPEATDLNALNAAIRQQIVQAGRFYLVQTTVEGRLYLRTALMNPFTEVADLRDLLTMIRKYGESLK